MIPEARIERFEKMGLGLFVHWGLYSQLGMGEWTYHIHNRNMQEYKKLLNTFTAEKFDAETLVLTAKNTGCKYINLTTRHHDGFSLYDTCGLNDFDAPHSAAGRDLVKEFVDACRKYDIAPFFYHTTLDWYNSDYNDNFDKYLDYLRKSIEILCTNYGKIGGLWFDGNWSKPDDDWKEDELYAIIRKYQPDAMIINNTGLGARGVVGNPEIDSVTFEQGRPTPLDRRNMTKYVSAEMCYTINSHWGIGHNDFNYKSPKELIECLCDCRKVGANFLLNIGPDAQGGIVPMQAELLNIIGKWMSIFGEAIYMGKPYNAYGKGKNFILKGEGCLYIFVFDLSRGGNKNVTVGGAYQGAYAFSGVADKIKSVCWMDNLQELNFIQKENMLCVDFCGYNYGTDYCVRVAKAII